MDNWTDYKSAVRAIARKLAKNDNELYEELVSEGEFCAVLLDPSKATRNLDAYVRQSIKFRMIDHMRTVRYRDHQRLHNLETYMYNGAQWHETEDGVQFVPAPRLEDDPDDRG